MRRRDDGWFAAYRAVEHVHALLSETPQQISRRGVAYAIYRQCDGRFASLGCHPLGEIRSIDKYDVAADRLDLGDHVVAPHDIDGLETQRFRDRNQRAPDAGVGTVLDHPGSRWQGDEVGQHQIRGWWIDAQHRELMDVPAWQRPKSVCIRLDPFRPCGCGIGHQGAVARFQMPDAAAGGNDTANAFRSHHAWQFRPITVAARNHQEVAHIDRRGFERDDHLALGRRADIGNVHYLHDLGRIAERFNLDRLHDRFLLVMYYIVHNRSSASSKQF